MRVDRIVVQNYRNMEALDLKLHENATMIYGSNGQGKTNLIEAIWLFTGAKSFRGAKERQLVQFDSEQARLRIEFEGSRRLQEADMIISTRRAARLNEIPLRSASELAGQFCAVVFSPTHLALIKSGPSEKRHFLDTSICQVKPRFFQILSQYERVLLQRNNLLKNAPYGHPGGLEAQIEIWDRQLAAYAAVICKTRASFLERLLPFARASYEGISRGSEQLDFFYRQTLEGDLNAAIPALEQELYVRLEERRGEDLRARVTTCGPHRDDVEINLNGASARVYGSQGQQRSCVLALKLAECELIRETIGEYPVMLLDDVMSELDAVRRDYLLNHLKGRQLIMTCCDKAYFKTLGQGLSVKLEAGRVISSRSYEKQAPQ